MSVEDLVPRVRRGLGVSSSYEAVEIPDIVRAACGRLLRDYNFPKSVKRAFLGSGPVAVDGNPTLQLNDDTFPLPLGFKRDMQLRFRDADEDAWSEPLKKREAYFLPSTGQTERYWIEGTNLCLDAVISDDGVGKQLVLLYQSQLVDSVSEGWLTTDFTDAVVYLSIMRGALEFRKPDVAKDYAGLWTDEQTSLAIYLNELEWGNVEMVQRERRIRSDQRYPIHDS